MMGREKKMSLQVEHTTRCHALMFLLQDFNSHQQENMSFINKRGGFQNSTSNKTPSVLT